VTDSSDERVPAAREDSGGDNRSDDGEESSSRPSRSFLSRPSEWLTFLVAAGSLAVAFATYRNAADTSDIKNAIGNLSELATQTKRQADATRDQLGAVRDQVGALRDQAEEAKLQTAAIAKQTEAIKASSDAAIRSAEANISAANAQRKMAEVTAQAQKPDVDLMELTVNGLNGEPDKDGIVHPTLFWRFRDTGGSSFTVKDVIFGVWTGDALPQEMFQEMPQAIRFDGIGVVVTNSIASAFAPKNPLLLNIPKDTRDALNRGDKKLFFFAKFEYWDNLKNEHSRCFGREFTLKDGNSIFAVPSGGDAYQCAT
jgi:hypothetical protein